MHIDDELDIRMELQSIALRLLTVVELKLVLNGDDETHHCSQTS